MFDKVVRVAALVVALSLAGADHAFACSATAPPEDELMTLLSLGAIGTGVLLSGVAIAFRESTKTQPATEDGSTTTLPAS